ncbi:hypothetical protein PIROE2DRAFT_9307 [Piromyces sp. E2]|nr:hypothetical protein PIROE2DRAFT_9307 [Piromyces sp. E2]|eukprot:OUM64006.1 hypothetical protein PIROE2DRAFT_9307 [Piromyces sp. E2]
MLHTSNPVFPGYDSKEALEALKFLKYLKNTIASDEIFKGSELLAFTGILTGTGIFTRYWDMGMLTPNQYQTYTPGSKKGINTHNCLVSGMNLGISKYIKDENKKAALEVIKYFTSEDVQREIIIKKYFLYTGITKFYDDPEICSILSCSTIKNARTLSLTIEENYSDVYLTKITAYLNEYLFGNREAEEVLKDITDIKKVYYFSYKTTIGLIMCTIKSIFGNMVMLVELIEKFCMAILIMILSFCEWNVKEIYDNIRAIVITIYIDVFSLILLIVMNYISLNNYEFIFMISILIIVLVGISNFILIYHIRLLFINTNKMLTKEDICDIKTSISNKSSEISYSKRHPGSVIGKIVGLHYTAYSIESESIINTSCIRDYYSTSKSVDVKSNDTKSNGIITSFNEDFK